MAVPRRRNLIIPAAVLIIGVALSLFAYINFSLPNTSNMESVRVGMAPNEVNTLIYIAQDQGYFNSNDLNVSIKTCASGLEAVESLAKGEVDIAVATEYVFASRVLAGEASLRVVGAIDRFFNMYLVARTDKGINQVVDLRAKTIGVTLGTAPEFFLGRFLELNGLRISQVTLVNTQPSQTPSVLSNGTVDAVVAWQPNVNAIEELLGNKVVEWPAQSDQYSYLDTICLDGYVSSNNVTVTKFLRALAQAETFVLNNPDESRAIIQRELNYTDIYITSVWSDHQFSLSLDQSQILAMQDEARWQISNNLANSKTSPNFVHYLYVDGLRSVKPGSVNIIG